MTQNINIDNFDLIKIPRVNIKEKRETKLYIPYDRQEATISNIFNNLFYKKSIYWVTHLLRKSNCTSMLPLKEELGN